MRTSSIPVPRRTLWSGAAMLAMALSGCGSLPLPEKPIRPTVYDFGPSQQVAPATTAAPTGLAITLPEVDAPRSLSQVSVLYRLAYSQSQSSMPYAHAAWSMLPAQLMHQHLRAVLGQNHPVLRLGDGPSRLELRIQLEEFSQVFTSPEQSHGLVRMRATALAPRGASERLIQQRVFEVQAPAPTPDAPGGVRALTDASTQVAQQIQAWVESLPIPAAASPRAGSR